MVSYSYLKGKHVHVVIWLNVDSVKTLRTFTTRFYSRAELWPRDNTQKKPGRTDTNTDRKSCHIECFHVPRFENVT